MINREIISKAESMLSDRVKGFEGALGTLDAILTNFGDYGVTLSCIALLSPEIRVDKGIPFAKFPGSEKELPLDCFHVDIIHHSEAQGNNPSVLKAIGISLAESWNRILRESDLSGHFSYNEENGYDVIYGTEPVN